MPKRKGVQSLLKSPTSRGEKDSGSERSGGPSPRSRRVPTSDHTHSPKTNIRAMAAVKQTNSSPRHLASGRGPANKATSPTSILHKNKHGKSSAPGSPTKYTLPSSPPLSYELSQMPTHHNPRVRFFSSGASSVASTEASQVHLMAAAGSVASSSAMSSSDENNNRENVFDRVLNMVMAEEKDRLNAMGMSRADPKSDAVRISKKANEQKAKDRFSKVDAKAKAAVAAVNVGNSTSKINDDLGLRPPDRMDLAPIDIDTGLEIGGFDAPIDMDTGLEVHHKAPIDMDTGLEVEYHDLNDDEVDEERWKRLNDTATMGDVNKGMKGLAVDISRRCRSYESPPVDTSLNRASSQGSDPHNYQRSTSECPSTNKNTKRSLGRRGSKKTKQCWAKDKDFASKEWVAFDKQGTKK